LLPAVNPLRADLLLQVGHGPRPAQRLRGGRHRWGDGYGHYTTACAPRRWRIDFAGRGGTLAGFVRSLARSVRELRSVREPGKGRLAGFLIAIARACDAALVTSLRWCAGRLVDSPLLLKASHDMLRGAGAGAWGSRFHWSSASAL
jgi:hypothetical protein